MKKNTFLLIFIFLLFINNNYLQAQVTPSPSTMEFGSSIVVLANNSNPSADQSSNALLNGFDMAGISNGSIFLAFATNGNGAGTDAIGGGSDAVLGWIGNGTASVSSGTLTTDSGNEIGLTSVNFAYEQALGGSIIDFTFTGKKDGATVGTLSLTSPAHNSSIIVDFTSPTTGSFSEIDELVITPASPIFGGFVIDELIVTAAVPANTAPIIGGTVANQNVNDTATIQPFSSITTTDVDGDNLSATITLDDNAKGVITGDVSGSGPYTISNRNPAAMQTALRALVFNPTDNRSSTSETTTFTVVVNDGTDSDTDNGTTVISNAVSPTVTSVSSSTANGIYKTGDNITISVTFSENVTVTGTPQITLETGTTDRTVNFSSGSGSTTLQFTYIVQAGDSSADLDYVATNSLTAGSGIRDSGNKDATRTLPIPGAANSLGNNKAIVIDGVAPTVNSVSVPANATYTSGQNLDFTVNLSENITVNTTGGSPQIAITIGSTTQQTVYQSGSGTNALLFRYTVQASDLDTDGITVGTLNANSGTLQDSAGNNANLTLNSVGNTASVLVDAVAPNGYSASIDQSTIRAANDDKVSFTFANAEVGSTYNYTFTSDGGAGSVTNSGTITTATDKISNIDLSGLPDGTITLNVSLTDVNGNTGSNTSDTVTKNTVLIALTITGLTATDKTYDATTAGSAMGTATLSGVIGADDVSLGGSPVFTFASANAGTNINVNTTGYTISGTDAANYTLTQPSLTADITTAALTVTGLTATDKTYDATTAGSTTGTATLSGIIGADDVSLGGSLVFTFASANAGTNINVNTTGYTISGTDAANYTLTQPSLTADITTAALTVTGLTATDKTYDATTAGSTTGTATLSGVIGADDVSLGGSPIFTFASANAGTNINVNTTGYTISGTDAANYTLTQPSLTADITTAALTVTGLTATDKTYDATTAGSTTGTATLSGIIGADDVSLGGSPIFTFASANAGTNINVNTTGYTISGTDAANYTLTQPSLTADITAKAITITADAKTKVYGETDPTLTYSVSPSLESGDVLTGSVARATGEDVGTYAIASTLANSNYNISFTSADFSITQKAITITADAKTKAYGEADPTLTYSVSPSLESGDVLTGGLSRATGEDVGTYAISSTLANSNYNISFTSADFSITQKAITITADAKTKVYGETDPMLTYSLSPSLESGDVLTGSVTRATGEDVGTYAISSTLANSNYNISFTSADFSITQKAITITADAKTKVYGEADPILTYSVSPSLESGDVLTGSVARATGEDVGTYAIASTLANSNYNISFANADFSITQKAITITADAKTKVYGEADPMLTYSVSPSLESGDVLTGSVARATGEDVGTYAISSTLANSNYNISFANADFSITQKAITITADAKTKVYGEADPTLTYTVTPSLESGDVLTGSVARATGEDVGTYAIASTLANSNYAISFTSADFSITQKAITVTADAKTKAYGEADPTLTYSVSPSLESGDVLTGGLSRATGEDVGTYAISSTLANSNYNISFTSADFSITQKAITITADAKTKVYGDSDPMLAYSVSPSLESGDVLTGGLSRATGEDVGTYAIASTLANSNYNISFTSADFSITQKAITITADAKTKVYGEADPILTYSVSPSLESGDVLTGGLSRATGEDVGTYAIASTLANSNYAISFTSADFSITQKAITVTADAKTKAYGEADPTLTYSVSPSLESGDVLTGGLSRATGEDVGTYAISSTLANSNYNISFTSADFSITQKAITITADAKTKVYGDSDPMLAYSVSPSLESGDVLTGGLSRATGEDVGTYAIASTLANSNYNISFTSADFSITQKAITITADAKTKVYGEADPTLTYSVSPSLESGDVLTGGLSRATGEDVGTYAISSTLANSNYNISFTSADFSITQKAITITADAKTKVYGETDPMLTYSLSPSLESGDVLTGSVTRATGEDVGTYAISSTLANSNYNISFTSADFSITQKAITITADAKTKVYGEADPILTYSVSPSLESGDVLTGSVARATGEDVGTYAIASTLANSNYNISFANADFSITQKAITITADAKTKVYGEADPMLTYSVSPSLESGDVLTGSVARATGEDVGTYAISSTLANSNYNISFANADFSITQKAITITADAKTKVYGEADPTLTYTVTPSLESGDVLTGSVARATGEDVGTYAIASTLANSNYAISFTSADFSITQKAITVTADAKTKAYGEADPTLTYSVSPSLESGDVLTGGLSRATGEDVGTYAIASTLANSNYNISFTSADFSITKASQTISFAPLTHDNEDSFTLTATTTSGLSVVYSSSDTSIATISGNVITIIASGSVTITASQPGNSNYNAATDVTQILNITTLSNPDILFESSNVLLYPNPAKNNIKIRLGIEKANINIFDMSGKLVKTQKDYISDNNIDISDLPIGVFVIRINNDKKMITKRLTKTE